MAGNDNMGSITTVDLQAQDAAVLNSHLASVSFVFSGYTNGIWILSALWRILAKEGCICNKP